MSSDFLQRFIFDDTDIRGEIARLDNTFSTALQHHEYPLVVQNLLGEFMLAAALLSDTIKFKGRLSLQCRSEGEIPLIMAEASSAGEIRAIAKEAEQASSYNFNTLLANGTLAITIEPDKGQRYQGIVHLDGGNLAACLEYYFMQSEQLQTRVWLAAEEGYAVGMMLQELPPRENIDADRRRDDWEHFTQLAATISYDELLKLDNETLLFRLYHQEKVRLFDHKPLCFKCSCSRQRCATAIAALGRSEAEAIIAEQGSIRMTCEFCHFHYEFGLTDLPEIFETPLH